MGVLLATVATRALGALKGVPWYVFALLFLAAGWGLTLRRAHDLGNQVAAWRVAGKSWAESQRVQAQSIVTLKASLAQCGASVDQLKAQGDLAAKRAAEALQQAQAAAQDRTKAAALLRAAPKPAQECPAPPAHNAIRGLL